MKEFDKNLDPISRVRAKAPGMNVPMTGTPEKDNITLLPDRPPIFHSIPNYDVEKNTFSFF